MYEFENEREKIKKKRDNDKIEGKRIKKYNG